MTEMQGISAGGFETSAPDKNNKESINKKELSG